MLTEKTGVTGQKRQIRKLSYLLKGRSTKEERQRKAQRGREREREEMRKNLSSRGS